MEKICVECGSLFENRYKSALYCSAQCKRRAKFKRSDQPRRRANVTGTSRVKSYTYTCQRCGKEYSPKSKDRNKYCSRECFFEWRREHPKEKPPKEKCVKERTVYNKMCEHCGVAFNTVYVQKKYCRDECKIQATVIRHPSKQKTIWYKACQECGQQFETTIKRQLYCCAECTGKHHNRKKEITRRIRSKANGDIEWSISLDKIYKRDNGICHICGTKVDMMADTNSNEYGSLDHIKPISKGGTHTWDNVKLAHRGCNTIKGNRLTYATRDGQMTMVV